MLSEAFVVSSFFLVLANAQTCPYAKFSSNHTFCKPPNDKCTIIGSGVTEADKKVILDTHNMLRNKIASGQQVSNTSGGNFPKASNMLQLVWDDELASIADKHTKQCDFNHDCHDCRRVDRYQWVGQNIRIQKSSKKFQGADWNTGITSWYNEVKDFPVNYIKPYTSGVKTGHFTQVVWAETVYVGCGYTTYNNMDSDKTSMPYAALYTCNYGPGGNMIGNELYKVGTPATACPAGYKPSTQFPALCTK